MAGMFSAIDSLSSALGAFQQELSVTSNNVSNVNTPGYSRQTANLAQAPTSIYTEGSALSVGNGVTVSSVARIQDMFLQQRSQAAASDTGRLSTLSDGLTSVQSLLNEPSTSGISTALSNFFNAWSGLSSSPSDPSQQLQVQSTAQTLTQTVQTLSKNLTAQASQNTQSISTTLSSIQTAINNIANINQQIHLGSTSSSQPSSLLDERDQALSSLSKLVDVQSQVNSDGTVNVSMNGMNLVDQTGARKFPTTFSAANSTVSDSAGNTFPVRSGQLSGEFTLSNTIAGYQTQLDNFANTVTTQVNSIYATATNAAGATNQPFFKVTTPAAGAAGFSLAAGVAANSTAIGTGTSGTASDGGVALGLSQLQNSSLAALGNQTIQGYYGNFVSSIGSQVSYYQSQVSTQSSVTTQINNQIQSVSGVSLDQEMSNMLEFQRSYQAAAQTLSSINSTMDSLMSMVHG
jgi:flagellar hook-associated protein 1 FlgK